MEERIKELTKTIRELRESGAEAEDIAQYQIELSRLMAVRTSIGKLSEGGGNGKRVQSE